MRDLKITVQQLKNYLGTGLLLASLPNKNGSRIYCEITARYVNDIGKGFTDSSYRPLVYKLSDLDKEIEVNGERFVPIEKIGIYNPSNKNYLIEQILTGMVEKIVWDQLVDMGFWMFGDIYFNEGLVIDKMTLKQ